MTGCQVTAGRNGRLTCILTGYSADSPDAAIKAISAALPSDFVMAAAPAPFLPSWVRSRDYMTVLLSVTRDGLAVSIEQSIKPPPASFTQDGNVTPVPIVTGKVEGGVAVRTQVAAGVVVAADATHSYVVSVIPPAALGAIRVGNPYAVTPRQIWRLEKPTVVARDDQTNLTLLSVDKLRVTPATFSRRTHEVQDVRVYYFNGTTGDVARSLDADWARDISSDDGTIRVIHAAPAGFDFQDDHGGNWNGSIVVDKATHNVVGVVNGSGRTTGNMWFGSSIAPIVALVAKAHLTLAFATEADSDSLTISNVPTPETMFVRRAIPSIARITVDNATGSGVVVARSGTSAYIATSGQVVKKNRSALVYFSNGTKAVRAAVVRTDPKSDLALLRVEGVNAPALGFARAVLPGLDVGVVEFDGGDVQFTGAHLSQGSVNSVDDAQGTFEYDAPVDQGNIGGPILELATGALAGLVEGQPNGQGYAGISASPIRRLLSGLAGT